MGTMWLDGRAERRDMAALTDRYIFLHSVLLNCGVADARGPEAVQNTLKNICKGKK
jgi:hypothetical protein